MRTAAAGVPGRSTSCTRAGSAPATSPSSCRQAALSLCPSATVTPRCTACCVTLHSCLLTDKWVHPLVTDKLPVALLSFQFVGTGEMEQIHVQVWLVVYEGSEGFKSKRGPCSLLGTKALGSGSDTPDFDAF